jgi:hypothetical protein
MLDQEINHDAVSILIPFVEVSIISRNDTVGTWYSIPSLSRSLAVSLIFSL